MQRFPCPHCGPRDEIEFHYAADAGKTRPGRQSSPEDWARYRFMRKNTKGTARELWQHAGGCGQWICIERDTVSHAVIGSEALGS
ncbi:MAG: sarcosine oxidase subunit delta [Hyphomicrobiaceae bacterium]